MAKAIETLNPEADAVRAMIDPMFEYEKQLKRINELYMSGQLEVEELIKAQEKLKEKMKDESGEKKIKSLQEMTEELADSFKTAAGTFFEDIISGSATAAEAFEKMAKTILLKIAELVAAAAAAWIVKTLFSSAGGAAGGQQFGPPAPGTQAVNAQVARLAASTAAATMGPALRAGTGADTTGGNLVNGTIGRPELKVVVNNNARDLVSTRQGDDGGLEITIVRVRRALSRDMRRGGNVFADSLERSFTVSRRGA